LPTRCVGEFSSDWIVLFKNRIRLKVDSSASLLASDRASPRDDLARPDIFVTAADRDFDFATWLDRPFGCKKETKIADIHCGAAARAVRMIVPQDSIQHITVHRLPLATSLAHLSLLKTFSAVPALDVIELWYLSDAHCCRRPDILA
jgi:hypothetical protein